MTPAYVDPRAPWPVPMMIASALVISAVRGLGNPPHGPIPALGALDAIKFLDVVLLIGLTGLVFLRAMSQGVRAAAPWKVWHTGCFIVVLAIGIASALYWGVPAYDAAQSLLFLLRPAALLLLFTAFPWRGSRSSPDRLLVAFTLANLAVVVFEWRTAELTAVEYSPDAVSGFFHDAHQQATFSYTMALLTMTRVATAVGWWRRVAWAAFLLANVAGGYLSQAQKTTGIEALVFTAALVLLIMRSRARLKRAARLVPAAVLTLVLTVTLLSGTAIWTSAAGLVTGNLMNRLDYGGYRGLSFVGDIGAVRMFQDFWTMSGDDPTIALIGAGPANYGSPAALRRVGQGSAPERLRDRFWWEAASEAELVEAGELRLLGITAKTSLPGVVLGECGPIALLAFLPLLLWPLTIGGGASDRSARGRVFWLRTAYAAVVVQSLVSTLGAWDNDVVLTLIFAGFAGALATREARDAGSGAQRLRDIE